MSKSLSHHRLLNKEKLMKVFLNHSKSIDWTFNPHLESSERGSLAQEVGRLAPSSRLKDGKVFCPQRCHNPLSFRMPQLFVLGMSSRRLWRETQSLIIQSNCLTVTSLDLASLCSKQALKLEKNNSSSLRQISAPNKSSWHDHCQCWFTALSKDLLHNIGMILRDRDPDHPPGLERFPLSVYLWLHYTNSHHKGWMHK